MAVKSKTAARRASKEAGDLFNASAILRERGHENAAKLCTMVGNQIAAEAREWYVSGGM